jgi:hypothetical protein
MDFEHVGSGMTGKLRLFFVKKTAQAAIAKAAGQRKKEAAAQQQR